MRNIWAVFKKELNSYFGSPIAYVIACVFLVLAGFFFVDFLDKYGLATMEGVFSNISFILFLMAPALTMRLLAEEQKTGTVELLLTAPIRDIEVVLGKYLASLVLLAAILIPTLYYIVILFLFGRPDAGPILSGYIGLLLMGAAFLSIGVLTSSLTSNQIVAAVLTLGILLAFWFVDGAGSVMKGVPAEFLSYLSLRNHYPDFIKGVVDTKDIIYYISVAAAFIFLTVRSLETRRWR